MQKIYLTTTNNYSPVDMHAVQLDINSTWDMVILIHV